MATKKSTVKSKTKSKAKHVAKNTRKTTKKSLKKSVLKKSSVKKNTVKKPTKKSSNVSSPKSSEKKIVFKASPITLQAGDDAPDFECKDQSGNTVRLSDFSGQKLVLYFYPKDLTPGCTTEACDFRDSLNRLKSLGVEVLGVSMDDEKLHNKFIEKYDLNFRLLSDVDGKLCYDYGALKEKNMYGKNYVGIARTTFIIENNKVLKVYHSVKAEGHVQQIINDLATL